MKNSIPNTVTQEILNAITELDEFKGAWRLYSKLAVDRLKSLQKVALTQSIKVNMHASDHDAAQSRVSHIVNQLNADHFDAEIDQIIAGYAFVSQEMYAHYAHIPFSQANIQQLHRWLCRYQKGIKNYSGQYKQRPNHIIATGSDGVISCVIAQTVLPYQTEEAMNDLVYMTMDLFAQKQLHPLQIIAHFIGQFLLIHPFDYHNHFFVHILAQFMLLQNGYNYVPFGAIEPLHADREQLYAMLSRAYGQKECQDYAINKWILYLLQRLVAQKRGLQEKIEREQALQLHVSDYAATLLNLIEEHGKLSLSELVGLTGFNKNTTKKHVQKLVKKQQVIMHGKARAAWYTVL